MFKNIVVKEILRQRRRILGYNHEYYVLDRPTIPDSVYDELYRDLVRIEATYPKIVQRLEADGLVSPTKLVGGKPLDSFPTSKHDTPMYSLDNVFDEAGMLIIIAELKKMVGIKEG